MAMQQPSRQCAPDPAGEKEDEGREDRADHERPRFGEDAQAVLEDEKRGGAHEGAEERPGAPEQGHHDHLARGGPVERLDRHDGEPQGVERPREPREQGGEYEREEPDAVDVVAARHRAVPVLADGLEHGAERRVEDPLEPGHRQPDQRVGEVVEAERGVEGEGGLPEPELELGDAAQPVVAARPVGQVEGDEVEELGEGQRQHGEVDAAALQAEEADDRAAGGGEEQARPEPRPQRAHLQLGERDAGAVGAEAVVGGVPEGEQARVAVEQVEAEGEEAEEGEHRAGPHPHGERADRGPAAHSSSPASPKSPLGRTSSTTAITTNTMISASLGAKNVVRPTTWPIKMRERSMPRARTIRGSREPARMIRPTLVRARKSQRPTSTAAVTTMTKSR